MDRILCHICLDDPYDHRISRTAVSIEKSHHMALRADKLVYFGATLHSSHNGLAHAASLGYDYARDNAAALSAADGIAFLKKTYQCYPHATSRAAICRLITNLYLREGHTVTLNLNVFSVPLTRWLIKRECRRAGLNWSDVRRRLHLIPTGGTFLFNIMRIYPQPVGILFWWLRHVPCTELAELYTALTTENAESEITPLTPNG